MRIRNLMGRSAGLVEELSEDAGQSMLDSGQGELVPQEGAEDAVAVVEVEEAQVVVEDAEADETEAGDDEADAGDAEGEGSPLESWTTAELEDLGDEYGIEASDIEGTGAGGNVVKADWVRVLDARMAKADEEEEAEGSEAEG